MVFIRAAEAEDIPSLQTLFLQLGALLNKS
ncbi:hypothetical protein N5I57_24695, partial [Klebsiella pneumoniae]|nr:hypothetical protein [Klebsiella pneumoniae]